MCGAPGSGKTYWAKKALELKSGEVPIKYFSRDEVRFEMVPEDEEYFSKEDAVFKEWIRRIQEALDSDEDCYVIADAFLDFPLVLNPMLSETEEVYVNFTLDSYYFEDGVRVQFIVPEFQMFQSLPVKVKQLHRIKQHPVVPEVHLRSDVL